MSHVCFGMLFSSEQVKAGLTGSFSATKRESQSLTKSSKAWTVFDESSFSSVLKFYFSVICRIQNNTAPSKTKQNLIIKCISYFLIFTNTGEPFPGLSKTQSFNSRGGMFECKLRLKGQIGTTIPSHFPPYSAVLLRLFCISSR